MSSTEKKTAAASKDMQRFSTLGNSIFVLTAILVISLSFYAFLYLILSMLPTLVAYFNDKSAGKSASNTVGAFNFMGVMPILFKIWNSGDVSTSVKGLITDPQVWLLGYGAASLGWLMVLFMPKLVSSIFTSRSDTRIQNLKKSQDKLVEDWGYEVKCP